MGACGWSCPWVLVPKDIGLVLPLGDSLKIVIIMTEYLVEH